MKLGVGVLARRLLALCLAALMTLFAVNVLIADLLHKQGLTSSYEIARSGYRVDTPTTAEILLSKAIHLNPYNADYRNTLARHYKNKLAANLVDSQLQRRSGITSDERLALGHFEAALRLSPHASQLWANYANALFETEADKQAVFFALDHSERLAPYRPPIMLTKLKIELLLWDDLLDERRQALKLLIEFLLEKNWRYVVYTAAEHGLEDLVQPLLVDDKNLKRLERAIEDRRQRSAPGD